MMVTGQPVANFVAAQLGFDRGFGPCSALGFCNDGVLVAGFVYHNWVPENGVVEISAASTTRRWMNRARLSAVFAYPFEELDCRMVVARHSEHNSTARRIWRSLGCNEYVIPELRSPTEAEVIATLTAEKWRSGKFIKRD